MWLDLHNNVGMLAVTNVQAINSLNRNSQFSREAKWCIGNKLYRLSSFSQNELMNSSHWIQAGQHHQSNGCRQKQFTYDFLNARTIIQNQNSNSVIIQNSKNSLQRMLTQCKANGSSYAVVFGLKVGYHSQPRIFIRFSLLIKQRHRIVDEHCQVTPEY